MLMDFIRLVYHVAIVPAPCQAQLQYDRLWLTFFKELYEPFLDELFILLKCSGVGIKSVWALDAAHQGASGILNEEVLGDDPCWNDYPRDVVRFQCVLLLDITKALSSNWCAHFSVTNDQFLPGADTTANIWRWSQFWRAFNVCW
jgi:hypothetical protein